MGPLIFLALVVAGIIVWKTAPSSSSSAITIERTGKEWKRLLLFAVGFGVVGFLSVFESPGFGFFLLLVGGLLYVAYRLGAWWHHG